MKIGILKEIRPGETRVALIPSLLPALIRDKHEIIIETGAGVASGFADDLYAKAGARVVKTAAAVYKEADIIFKVQPPATTGARGKSEVDLLRDGTTYIGYMAPLANPDLVKTLREEEDHRLRDGIRPPHHPCPEHGCPQLDGNHRRVQGGPPGHRDISARCSRCS